MKDRNWASNIYIFFLQELSIKTEGDVLIVLAKHETKAEGTWDIFWYIANMQNTKAVIKLSLNEIFNLPGGQSFVSKQFEQRFSLPSGVKPEKISSSLSKVSLGFRVCLCQMVESLAMMLPPNWHCMWCVLWGCNAARSWIISSH